MGKSVKIKQCVYDQGETAPHPTFVFLMSTLVTQANIGFGLAFVIQLNAGYERLLCSAWRSPDAAKQNSSSADISVSTPSTTHHTADKSC